MDGVDGRWGWQGEVFAEPFVGGAGGVDGAAITEAGGVGAAGLGNLAGAGDGVVVEGGPLVAEFGEGGELGVIVEAKVAEEGADDGAVLLFDAVVVVFVVGAGAGDPELGVVGVEKGKEVVVDEFAAVVDVDDFGWEGEAFEEVGEGTGGGFGATVPTGGEAVPLGGGIGDMEDPKETFAEVAAAEGDGVDLEDAGFSGLFKCPWAGGDLGGEGGLGAGAFVGCPWMVEAVAAKDAFHRGGAHAQEFIGDGRWDFGRGLGVVLEGFGHHRVEVFWAELSHRQPNADEAIARPFGVNGATPFVFSIASVAGQEPDDVFSRESRHEHGLGDKCGALVSFHSLGIS